MNKRSPQAHVLALQQRVAGIVAGLADAEDFVLAGGAALTLHGMVERSTRDLDDFATASDAVAALLPALEAALRRDGLRVARRRDAPGFVRLEVTDETQQVIEVDLAYDARLLPAQPKRAGWGPSRHHGFQVRSLTRTERIAAN